MLKGRKRKELINEITIKFTNRSIGTLSNIINFINSTSNVDPEFIDYKKKFVSIDYLNKFFHFTSCDLI